MHPVYRSRWNTKGVQEDYGTAENEKGLALVKALTLSMTGAGCRTRTRHPMITNQVLYLMS